MASSFPDQDYCRFHGKRYLEFVCVERQCETKEKRGCNLCFKKNGRHQDHTFLEVSELMQEINEFQIQEVLEKIKQKAKHTIIRINQELDEWYLKVVEKCEEIEIKYEEIEDIDTLIEIYRIKQNEKILPLYQWVDMYQESMLKSLDHAQNYLNYYYNSKYIQQKNMYANQIHQLKEQFSDIYIKNPLRDIVNYPFNFDSEELENSFDTTLYPTIEETKFFDSQGNHSFKIKAIFLSQKKDNLSHGRMFSLRETGECYEGYMVKDQKHGKGKLINEYGHVYIGEFKLNKKQGHGIYLFGSYKYEGEFRDNKYHGYGKMLYQNGDCYEGFYRYGMRHGKGQFTYAAGKVKIGFWIDDRFVNETINNKDDMFEQQISV